jgi:glc operon protein GlcG
MRRRLSLTIALALVGLATALPAAPSRAAGIAQQPVLTRDGAKHVVAAAVAEAMRLRAPGTAIAVVDAGGSVLAVERLDGTFAAGAEISVGKAKTAVRFKKPTRVFEDIINKGRTAMTTLPDFTPLQGGVPLEAGGVIVGGIGVSGAASAAQDEEIALAAAKSMSEITASNDAVSYFGAADVKAAFAKGAVLLDGTGRNYMVHASRREKAGEAEVHARDTDVIYVLGGTATIVTGGEVVEAREVEPGELRGHEIRGGAERHLAGGDVLVVPSGVPHWFSAVDAPFTYYVVKVR